mmetsp:Transcript_5436/g.8034  ORF Transcript_5436/g.8034 Transcript_5436/m.8034 type:complete len:226 (+) Transcript_5436:271-948(+)
MPYALAPKSLDQVMVQARLAGVNCRTFLQVKVLMATRDAGKIFGQGGRVLQHIKELSGCERIRFSEQAEGSKHRVSTLEGSSPSIVIGLSLFAMLLCGDILRSRCQIILLVDAANVGYIIGKSGVRINKIRQEAGADISLTTNETIYHKDGGRDNKVVISGSPAAVSKAISRVIFYLNKMTEESMIGSREIKERIRERSFSRGTRGSNVSMSPIDDAGRTKRRRR